MQSILIKFKLAVRLLLFLTTFYSLQRLFFLLFNFSFFKNNTFIELFTAFLWGIRFDLWIILAFNSIIFLLIFLPLKSSFKNFSLYYILTVNGLLTFINLIDIAYYPFTLKRSTSDLFNLITTGKDVWILLPQFIIDYWYIIFLWFTFLWLLLLTKKFWKQTYIPIHYNFRNITLYFFIYIFTIGIMFGVIRGTRLRPVNLLSASLHANPTLTPLVLNTPFSIVKTIGKPIHKKHFYFENESDLIFKPIYNVKPNFSVNDKKNVVILILESFSKEHIGFFNNNKKKSFTPFLDSLLSNSFVIKYSYSNGRKSIESLPSILASIPSLMETPYILSTFSSNQIEGLPAILKKHGYQTSFYHGGTNGTMRFDVFSRMAGIENYYGRWEYPNADDYDGNWGIWDEPYLQYVKNQLDKTKNPFFTLIYTLSSHHPYNIPDKYKNVFQEGEHKILKSIAYTDYSLKLFFENAKKSEWFKNTLFVITADHVFGSHSDFYYNEIGSYTVPISFYCETDNSLKGIANIIAQHCDIAPSILDYLGIKTSMFAFGSSIWDTLSERFAINYINGTYKLLYDEYFLRFDGEKVNAIFNFKNDSLLQNNLINENIAVKEKMTKLVKSIIQQYDYALINNKMKVR